jgi:hypothetical protein
VKRSHNPNDDAVAAFAGSHTSASGSRDYDSRRRFFFLLYFIFALYKRKNEVQNMASALLPQEKSV